VCDGGERGWGGDGKRGNGRMRWNIMEGKMGMVMEWCVERGMG